MGHSRNGGLFKRSLVLKKFHSKLLQQKIYRKLDRYLT